ncbi:MAG: hypothetical protein K0V04_32745 [Deltaproteobacteria bacterium]|nr:hypothetical protein [Deltaproteobacteria bacterium]
MDRSQVTANLLFTVPLAIAGCSNEGAGGEDSDSTADTTAAAGSSHGTTQGTTGDDTTTSSGAADDTSEDSTTTGPVAGCQQPQAVPRGPDCTGVDGVLMGSAIIAEGLDTPDVLVGIREVTGSVRINSIDVTNLDFMECLQTVGGDVTIFGNDQLTNVDGLWSLTDIGTNFIFTENDALIDFDGLPNVVELGNSLVIRHNDTLTTISGLHQLTTVHDLIVQNNDALLDIDGLGGLTTLTAIELAPGFDEVGTFSVSANPTLCISSVNCVGEGITDPSRPPPDWTTQGNDDRC